MPEFAFSLFSTSVYTQGRTDYEFEVMYNAYESQSTFAFIIIITLYFKTSTDNDSSGTCSAFPIWTLDTDEVKNYTFS